MEPAFRKKGFYISSADNLFVLVFCRILKQTGFTA
jgi:hypothetical protein